MRIARLAFVCAAVPTLVSVLPRVVISCPFCSAPSLTLTAQVAQSDAVAMVQWVEGQKAVEGKPGSTTYEVLQVVKRPAVTNTAAKNTGRANEILKKGGRVALARYRAGQKGDLFMLMGIMGTVIEWGRPLEVTETSFNYVAQAPSPEVTTQKRLAYFLKFLEFPDQLIANDAFAEFANAPYKDMAPLSKIMPRERIRKWVVAAETPQTRLGLYGLLLGLCGTPEDALLMEKKITEPTADFRLGIEGVMSGYLLLTGAKGLDLVDLTKLRNTSVVDKNGEFVLDEKGQKKQIPFSETYAAMKALRFMWTYGDGRIKKERLRQSMRILLDRPKLADLVIADLARWKDWSVQDRLMKLYGADEYNIPSIKRSIVRYMLASTKDTPAGGNVKTPPHVVKGKEHLAALRKKDPRTVREAERFFFLR